MTHCPRCGTQLATPGTHCASCGYELVPARAESEHLIRRFLDTLRQILLEPTAFFRKMPVKGGFAEPLAFALICHWIGTGLRFLWTSLSGNMMQNYVSQILKTLQTYQASQGLSDIDSASKYAQWSDTGNHLAAWFWGTSAVIADPFFALAMIFVTTFFIWLGARLLVTPGKDGAPSEITFETALRIKCYGLAPAILAGIPFVGGLVAAVYGWIVTIIAAKNVYRIGTTRATFVALFTHVIILAIMMVGFGLVMFMLFRVMSHF